ncbi:proliferating cell nuclear antigen (pcna) [Candidatus Woesearchaeota archaeon]|nr:proliferating cell nuclear antigen (pcna) [Candidatus Woesearchaeota archaeon]USN43960.1 MAG: proliferating cell nuclear antigen (pcna) [Candidatus Woesearchaeota archaeon]
MELVLENPSLLKKSMEIISDIVLEATLVFKKDYMEMVALNSNNVVMVVFRLLSTNFDKYELTEEKKISLSLEHLSNVLKRCDDKAKLTMEVKDNAKLRIVSEGKNKKEFGISLIDFVDENIQKVPNLDFPLKIVSSSSEFTNAINDLSFLEEGVSFKAEKGQFTIEGKTNSMSGKIDFKEDVDVRLQNENEKYLCRYSIEYLKKFIKAEKIVGTVELSFKNDFPLKVEYKVVDRLLLGFILAPRGED